MQLKGEGKNPSRILLSSKQVLDHALTLREKEGVGEERTLRMDEYQSHLRCYY